MQHCTGPDLMIICLAAMHDSSDDTYHYEQSARSDHNYDCHVGTKLFAKTELLYYVELAKVGKVT